MAFQKFTKSERTEVLSPKEHQAVQTELHRLGKRSARELSEVERKSLEIALDSAEESC